MSNQENNKNMFAILCVIALVIYLLVPPKDKLAQIGYSFSNMKYYMGGQNKIETYKFHRNNAIYLTRMDNITAAISEMDKAINSIPSNSATHIVDGLYRDRAEIELFHHDYKKALNDYLKISNIGINDYLKVAMLLKENGKYRTAVSYCNKIIDVDIKAYAGYACVADIYASLGKYEASIAIFDLLIDRSPNKGRYYADRALYKQKVGDIEGHNSDIRKAKDLSPVIDLNASITYDVIHPKKVALTLY